MLALSLQAHEEALERGLAWLMAAQQVDGSWPDFIVAPTTEGREWTTGYVATQLAGLHLGCSQLTVLERAYAFLHANRRPTGGWGFAASTPVDADSTAWCLLALLTTGAADDQRFAAERAELRAHFRPDGGFGTYRHANLALYPQDSGYYTSSPCVTAAVALALHRLGAAKDAGLVRRAQDYLWSTRQPEGWWPSFWWERGIYSTAIVVRLLLAVGVEPTALAATAAWLRDSQTADGSWCGLRAAEPNAFLTATALGTLLDLEVSPAAVVIQRGLGWLLDAQGNDGAWLAPPIMQVPLPERPWSLQDSPSGVLIPAQRGHFITATVLGVLTRIPTSRTVAPLPRIPRLHDPALDHEVNAVIALFDNQIAALPPTLRALAQATPAWAQRGAGLSHYLPYWLDTSLGAGNHRGTAHQMVLANRFGQIFCLLRDGVIDADPTTPRVALLFMDALFYRFVHGYQRIFPYEHPFWLDFDRYWNDYLEALAWEKQRDAWARPFTGDDLPRLGQKFSPVKICAAGMMHLAGRLDLLPALENLIDALQIGYQLLDDLHDWHEDLLRGAWTWPLSLVRQLTGTTVDPEQAGHLLWDKGIAIPVLEKTLNYLTLAARQACDLGLQILHAWIQRLVAAVKAALTAAQTAAEQHGRPLLPVAVFDSSLVFNMTSGTLYVVEPEIAVVAAKLVCNTTGSADDIQTREIIAELDTAGVLAVFPPPKLPYDPLVTTLFLNATAGNAHRCISCSGHSAGTVTKPLPMDSAIAERAINEWLNRSRTSTSLRLVYLYNGYDCAQVQHLFNYAQMRAEEAGKSAHFYLVSDPRTLDITTITELAKGVTHLHLVQDGVRNIHELVRLFDLLGPLLAVGFKQVTVNLSLAAYADSIEDLVVRLQQAGPDLIGIQPWQPRLPALGRWSAQAIRKMQADFSRLADGFVHSLEGGTVVPLVDIVLPLFKVYRRVRQGGHCGAGMNMLVVSVDGQRWPCFRFLDMPALELGSVVNPFKVEALQPYQRPPPLEQRVSCSSCWARYLCGGGCYDNHVRLNGCIYQPDPGHCALITHQFAEAIRLTVRLKPWLSALQKHFDQKELMLFLAPLAGC